MKMIKTESILILQILISKCLFYKEVLDIQRKYCNKVPTYVDSIDCSFNSIFFITYLLSQFNFFLCTFSFGFRFHLFHLFFNIVFRHANTYIGIESDFSRPFNGLGRDL